MCIVFFLVVKKFHISHPSVIRFGAGNGARTRDIKLGKLALYQLSYARPQVFHVITIPFTTETWRTQRCLKHKQSPWSPELRGYIHLPLGGPVEIKIN